MSMKIIEALQGVVGIPFHVFYNDEEKSAILRLVNTLLEHKNSLHLLSRNHREIIRLSLYLTLGCNGWQFPNLQKTSMSELLRIIDMVDRMESNNVSFEIESQDEEIEEREEQVGSDDEEENEILKKVELQNFHQNFEENHFETVMKNLYGSMQQLVKDINREEHGEYERNSEWYWDYSSMRDHLAAASDLVLGKNLATPAISEPYRWVGAIAGTDMFDKDKTKTVNYVEGVKNSIRLWKKHLFLHSCFNEKLMKINAYTMQMVEFVTGTKIYITIRALHKVQYRFTVVSTERRRVYAAVGVLQCVFNHNIQFSMHDILNIIHLIAREAPSKSKIIHCTTELPTSLDSLTVNSLEHPLVIATHIAYMKRKQRLAVHKISTNVLYCIDSEYLEMDSEFRLVIPQKNVCKFNTIIEFDKKFSNRLIGTDAAITLFIEHVTHVAISFHRVPGKGDKRQVSIHSMKAANLFAAANLIELLLHYNLGFEAICCTLLRHPKSADRLFGRLSCDEMGPWRYVQLSDHPVWNEVTEAATENMEFSKADSNLTGWLSESGYPYVDYTPSIDADETNRCSCGVREVDIEEFWSHFDNNSVDETKQMIFEKQLDIMDLKSYE